MAGGAPFNLAHGLDRNLKRHHPDYLDWQSLVQELLCWGWIDSLPKAIDADRTGHLAAPRNPASAWSAENKAHAERAIALGVMTPAGLAKNTVAKANGMRDILSDVEALIDPPDLIAALQGPAAAVWDALPRSVKRGTVNGSRWPKPPPPAPPASPRWRAARRKGCGQNSFAVKGRS